MTGAATLLPLTAGFTPSTPATVNVLRRDGTVSVPDTTTTLSADSPF